MRSQTTINIVNKFRGKKIGVIGDLMLDKFIWGDVERISPEAPVPVVFVKEETYVPGGAANTANNITALGGQAFMVGLVGEDAVGNRLVEGLKKRGIDIGGVIKDSFRPTTQKVRIIARGQQVVRIDKEVSESIDSQNVCRLLDWITSRIDEWDGLVISDYAKGLITETLAGEIIALARRRDKIVIGDIKPVNAPLFKNISLLTPNLHEAEAISGKKEIGEMGRAIRERLSCNALITQGPSGMTLFTGENTEHFPAKAKKVFDVVGAGDTVAANMALALASGASYEEAAVIANHAAGIVVGKVGTSTVSPQELIEYLQEQSHD